MQKMTTKRFTFDAATLSKAKKADIMGMIEDAPELDVKQGREWLRLSLTVGMGCGIPLLSLSLSSIGGTLARSGAVALPIFAAFLTAAVLAVSLSHLAWAIGDITRSDRRSSWALAIALDCSIVFCELVHVYATDASLNVLSTAVMVAVCGVSMVLNCWAFLNHR